MSLRWSETDYERYLRQGRPAPISEAAFQAAIIRLARQNNYLYYHTHNSKRSPEGFPDLVLAKAGAPLLCIELKTDTGQVTPGSNSVVGSAEEHYGDCGRGMEAQGPGRYCGALTGHGGLGKGKAWCVSVRLVESRRGGSRSGWGWVCRGVVGQGLAWVRPGRAWCVEAGVDMAWCGRSRLVARSWLGKTGLALSRWGQVCRGAGGIWCGSAWCG